MATPEQAPPVNPSADHAEALIAIFWVQAVIAIFIVALRFYARRVLRGIGVDDWLMLIALVFVVAQAGFVTKYALLGGTKHLSALEPAQMKDILMWSYILQCWGIFAFVPEKASVAMLIIRIMKPLRGWRFWSIVVVITLLTIFNTLDSIFTYVQCDPPKALWDRTITDAKCWDPSVQANYSIFLGSYNVFVDVFLALLPITIIWYLKVSTRKKIALIVLLSLGLLAAVCGSAKTSELANLSARSDLTWKMYGLIILSGTENFIILFCGSIPPLASLWDHWRHRASSYIFSSSLGRRLGSRSGTSGSSFNSTGAEGTEIDVTGGGKC